MFENLGHNILSSSALLGFVLASGAGCGSRADSPDSSDFRNLTPECHALDGGAPIDGECETDSLGGSTSGATESASGDESGTDGCDTDECVCEPFVVPTVCNDEMELCACQLDDDEPQEPGANPTDIFDCPAHRMKYCRLDQRLCDHCSDDLDEDDNPAHFDCDDYSLACVLWAAQQDPPIKACQLSYWWRTKEPKKRVCRDGDCRREYTSTGGGHAINVVEFEDEYCLIEPQIDPHKDTDGDGEPDRDQRYCCWPKGEGASIDQVPNECKDKLCAESGGEDYTKCEITKISCDPKPLPNAGEEPFWVNPGTCELIGDKCGIVVEPPVEPVCDCEHDVKAATNEAKGWECLPNTCKFFQNGDQQDCHCNWLIKSPNPSPNPVP